MDTRANNERPGPAYIHSSIIKQTDPFKWGDEKVLLFYRTQIYVFFYFVKLIRADCNFWHPQHPLHFILNSELCFHLEIVSIRLGGKAFAKLEEQKLSRQKIVSVRLRIRSPSELSVCVEDEWEAGVFFEYILDFWFVYLFWSFFFNENSKC